MRTVMITQSIYPLLLYRYLWAKINSVSATCIFFALGLGLFSTYSGVFSRCCSRNNWPSFCRLRRWFHVARCDDFFTNSFYIWCQILITVLTSVTSTCKHISECCTGKINPSGVSDCVITPISELTEWLALYVLDQEVSSCRTRGESEEYITRRQQSMQEKGSIPGFETQGRCLQKSKTGVTVASQKGLWRPPKYF